MTIDARPTVAEPDDDPYLWLEDINGQGALEWAEAQNRRTLARFTGDGYSVDVAAITAILDHPGNVPGIVRRGPYLYNFWTDALHPRGQWRRTTLDSYRLEEPLWEVVLDLDAVAASEGEDWIWGGILTLPGTHDRAMVYLSRGGSDAAVVREFDVMRKEFVAGGFELPESKGAVDWLDRDTLILTWGGELNSSGVPRTVRLWRRGVDPAEAPVLLEGAYGSASVGGTVDHRESRVVLNEMSHSTGVRMWFADLNGENLTALDLPLSCEPNGERGWLTMLLYEPWSVGGETYASGTLLGIGLKAFREGNRDVTVLFRPDQPRRSLRAYTWTGGRLILQILDDLRPVFEVITPSEQGWSREPLGGLPDHGLVRVGPLDAEPSEANDDLLAAVESPLTPESLLLIPAGAKAPTLLKRAPAAFTTDGLVVTRHEAVSSDGERIPYWQTGPAGETGDAPVHLTGYGGFGISKLPSYDAIIGKVWLERGGTSVLATIRGGGEFGPAWRDAARWAGRRLAHDDFAAVAADLVRRGVTRPGRIAAEGGSNGGLLIANMLTRYPERFGALACTIPVIDMRRYTKLFGRYLDEYGDPEQPEHWAWLQTYSAYHQAVPGQAYPPILLATTRSDDRAHPGHARKMAAKLQAMGYKQVYFHELETGGHSLGKDTKSAAASNALLYAFLREKIGWL